MKKLLFVIIALYTCTISAQTISVEQAMNNARNFLSIHSKRVKSANSNLELAYTSKDNNNTYYYAFNNSNEGFVIASGDEVAETILAYSEHGHFDPTNINPNFKWWLEQYEKQIVYAKSQGISEYANTTSTSEAKQDVPILVETRWDQLAPYNNEIKTTTKQNYLTGCVATAMCQVMKTHEWPVQGSGSHTYKDEGFSNKTYTRTFSDHTYDWKNMLNVYNAGYDSIQAAAVATLMFDAGVSINMQYGTSIQGGSGAYTEHVPYALVNYFGYDKGIHHAYRDYYTDDDWANMLYAELAAGRPVMYSGCDTGGHSFICDGYKASTDQYHFNWGWSGDNDCYCPLSAVKCAGTLWKYYQDMIMGIQKPVDNSRGALSIIIFDDCPFQYTVQTTDSLSTYQCTFGTYYDQYYHKSKGFLYNNSWKAGSAVFNIKFTNQATGKTYFAKYPEGTAPKSYSFPTSYLNYDYEGYQETINISNVITPKLPVGTYHVSLVYQESEIADINNDSLWTEVLAYQSAKNYQVLKVESNVPVPEIKEATNITESGFTANWAAVKDAVSYSLSLTKQEKEAKEEVALLIEEFNVFAGVTSDGSTDISTMLDQYGFEGWSGTKLFKAPHAVKLGSSNTGGSLTTMTLNASDSVVVIIGEKPYAKDNTTINVKIGETEKSFTATGAEHIFKVKINGDFNVSISTSGTKQRAYINKIVVMSNTNSEENILIENITDTCYEFTNLDNQHTYVYQVRCVTDEGTSKWSKYSQKIELSGSAILLGDANNDGEVNVNDITTIATFILTGNVDSFNFENADVNKDGIINVNDITGTASIILAN